MSSKSYCLLYYNARGKAETARLCFALAGIPYEDKRLSIFEWTSCYSHKFSFPDLPILVIDRKEALYHSTVIARYIANEYGFGGGTTLEVSKVEMWMAWCDDIGSMLAKATGNDPTNAPKTTAYKDFVETQLPQVLNNLNSSAGSGGFFVGSTLTVADLHFFCLKDWLTVFHIAPEWKFYPNLSKILVHVQTNPKIAQWLHTRPVTKY